MNDDNYFSYQYSDDERNLSFHRKYEFDTPWDEVLKDYIDFLSFVYGYDIRDKVSFETLEEKTERLSSMFEGD